MATHATDATVAIRRELRSGDPEAIVDLHERVYASEYGRNRAFLDAVATALEDALRRGWPHQGGGVWLIDASENEGLAGCLAWTREAADLGQVRWFVFGPELRGGGFGRRLLGELLSECRAAGMTRLELTTFSALTAAAHLYRSVGFEVVSARERTDWGSPIVYQHYALARE